MNSQFAKWASAPPGWMSVPGNDLGGFVISSRVRIARNVAGLPFPHNNTLPAQNRILKDLSKFLASLTHLKSAHSFYLNDLSLIERSFLMERPLISREHACEKGERGLIVTAGEIISIMINEEDHIRAASFQAGLGLLEAWETLSALDDELMSKIPLAWDPAYGFITACPTNLGTGLRGSSLLHLPALSLTGKIQRVVHDLNDNGFVTRGFYGEGSRSLGDLLQISNSRTLGRTEAGAIKEVEKIIKGVCALEKKEEQALLEGATRPIMYDRVFRSLGTLKSARLLSFVEAMGHLSMVRLGILLKFDIDMALDKVTHLFFLAQPAHLMVQNGALEDREDQKVCADFLREKFKPVAT